NGEKYVKRKGPPWIGCQLKLPPPKTNRVKEHKQTPNQVNPVDSLSFTLGRLRCGTHKPGKTETDQDRNHCSDMQIKIHLSNWIQIAVSAEPKLRGCYPLFAICYPL